MQILAVDWSGRASGAAEAIWLAQVVDGELVALDNGRTRERVVRRVVKLAKREKRTVVGLDFAFSFPAWWCAKRDWSSGREVWDEMAARGEELLAASPSPFPFWGRAGSSMPLDCERLRETEQAVRAGGAPVKSVFQIGGAGAVGTGSLRGMPHLATLQDAGFAIWPFDDRPGRRVVVEIYPRLLTGPVVKTRHRVRRAYLAERFADQDPVLIERAAGSEDAFDAAVSALAMAEYAHELTRLPSLDPGDLARIEGRIWRDRRAR